jgi:type I restriction enzyme S subunit
MTTNMIARRAFAVWWKDLDRWIIPTRLLLRQTLPPGWTRVQVGTLIRQVRERIKVVPKNEYKMAGVKWYGEGVFHRETVRGEEMSARYVTPLIPGALIYNRLFAWKASFAVVPPTFADGFVSNEFPQFILDTARILPEYLYLFCTREATIRAVNAASTGSAAVSRNRFKEDQFLGFEIPLPQLTEQKAIVARWRKAQDENAAARERVEKLKAVMESQFFLDLGLRPSTQISKPKAFAVWWKDLVRFSMGSTANAVLGLDRLQSSIFPDVKLGSVAAVSYGIQKCPANRPGQYRRPYLRVANVRKGYLDLSEVKEINVPDSEMDTYRLLPGDILFVEGNGSRSELGRVAKWNGEIEDCIHQNHLIKVRVDQTRLLPDYAMTWFNTEVGRGHFFRAAKTTSGLGTINSSEVRNAPIPIPPLIVQKQIMERVAAGRAEIAREREAAERLTTSINAEIEAMILGTKSIHDA